MTTPYDPRLTPARPDLAAAHLRGQISAARYEVGTTLRVGWESLALQSHPDETAAFGSELLFGERFTVYETLNGWAWGQSASDGYVGYVDAEMLRPDHETDHHVILPYALTYAEPELKSPPLGALPYLSEVRVDGQSGRWLQTNFGWMPGRHLRADPPDAADWVSVAERLLNAPYLWGGRTARGLDCSALVQLGRMGAGFACPRDSDMQEALGQPLGEDTPLQRGDLVFWKGHVGIMQDADKLLHANAYHMACVSEPLELARDRIEAQGDGPVTSLRRL